ncbi:MAG: isoprenylcysteine carboxylmethyltransferase family protein [Bacteroidales bacterium]
MNYIVLVCGSVFIALFSWFFSISHRRYHGIPRFFAFESIFVLLLLNYRVWFLHPFSVAQIISWIVLIFSAWAGIEGFLLLKRRGRPLGEFENTTVLVKTGVYGVIRHPLYLSLLLLGTGIMLKDPGLTQVILGIVILTALYFTAKIEEKEMIERFGNNYTDYMKNTKMFLPFLL